MRKLCAVVFFVLASIPLALPAQQIQINKENKPLAISPERISKSATVFAIE